jgi:hypothetical protein
MQCKPTRQMVSPCVTLILISKFSASAWERHWIMSTTKIPKLAYSREEIQEKVKIFIMTPIPDLLKYDEGGPGLDIERGKYIRTH